MTVLKNQMLSKLLEPIKQKQICSKHFSTINWLHHQCSNSSNPSGKTICNLSSYLALKNALNF